MQETSKLSLKNNLTFQILIAMIMGGNLGIIIHNNLSEEGAKEFRLIYMLKNLTADTTAGLFSVIDDLSPEDSKFCTKLVIINRTDYPRKGVLSNFDVVKFIDK